PSITQSGGGNHPDPNPTRSPPAIQPAHQAVIAPFDETPELACDGHVVSPRVAPISNSFLSNLFCSGAHIPQHARSYGHIFKMRGPFPAEPHFVHPVP